MVNLRIRPVILLFGDSLTQLGFGENGSVGWASLIASEYSRRADVINRGFSGYNTNHALQVLPGILGGDGATNQRAIFGTVWLGANDASLPGGRQHVPISEYKENLTKIVVMMKEKLSGELQEDVPIFLLTPPPVHEETWAEELGTETSDRHNKVAKEYGDCVKTVGAENGCHVLDVFDLLGGDGDDYPTHLSDGLHLSGSGNTIVAKGLLELIGKEFPHLVPVSFADRDTKEGIQEEEADWKELC